VVVEAISVSTRSRHQQSFLDIGCTSVRHFFDDSSLLVGTKKGGILHLISSLPKGLSDDSGRVTDDLTDIDAGEGGMEKWSKLESTGYETRYPIYSITTATQGGKNSLLGKHEEKFIFCGSGDRWISVWKVANHDVNDNAGDGPPNTQTRGFEYVHKLGPHTGWVKALVYDEKSRILHSIGCNCIESWDCSRMNECRVKRVDDDNDDDAPYKISHIGKRTIENCPTLGTTLSSDLLCLCLVKSTFGSDEELSRLLVSGGVDGRIHLWTSDFCGKRKQSLPSFDGRTPLHTTLAHNGRVNAIAYSSTVNAIFTVGNDGVFTVFRVSSEEGFESISTLAIEDVSNENASRLTAVSITKEHKESSECSLAVGTSKGGIYFITAKLKSDGGVTCRLENDRVTVKEGSMIYSLSHERTIGKKSSRRLWVGHASGLVALSVC